jgi:chromosome segregation protein
MFEFKKLEVVHWDYWQRFTLPMDSNIITIIGPNGSGKTTLLDALRTILNIECSSGRDYKRYVRRNNQAWLRAVVANTRSASGRYPFFPLTDAQITLACRIKKKGGDWQRQYLIEEGDVPIETLEKTEAWLGVRDYSQRLESAGLTQAIKRVLSLEQGDTDKLCELSSKSLLSLVFDVFGDKEALDNYTHAKTEQREIARELDELQVNLSSLGARLRESEAEVESYNQWQHLQQELLKLDTEILPRVELSERKAAIDLERQRLNAQRRSLRQKQWEFEQAGSEDTQDGLPNIIRGAEQREQSAQQELARAEQAFLDARDQMRDAEKLLGEQTKLNELAKKQAGGTDLAQISKQSEKLRSQISQLDQTLSNAREKEQQAQSQLRFASQGERVDPGFVTDFTRVLRAESIDYQLLADTLDITDREWQRAIEGILLPYKHVVLLQKAQDRQRAWALGQEHRYRHYIVADRARCPSADPGSLLEVVEFRAEPPDWLPDLLNSIRRVRDVAEGSKLPARVSWITPDGYYRDRRGGRYIGVDPREFFFGKIAQQERASDVQRSLGELRTLVGDTERKRDVLVKELREAESVLRGSDAGRMLEARAAEFLEAEQSIEGYRQAVQRVGLELAAAQQRKREASEAKRECEKRLTERDTKRDIISKQIFDLACEIDDAQEVLVEHIRSYRKTRAPMPSAWRTGEAMAALAVDYESVEAVKRDTQRLRRRLDEGEWIHDERVLAKRDKLRDDFNRLENDLSARQVHHVRLQRITDDARASYINVLRATIRRYGKNLKSLGELAGIGVEVDPPHLDNDDVILAQAGLHVKFNFDQKGMIGLNDGEASGGQQVMKSLILLVGMMMDDTRAGGFVFIDEPFAHLDIYNIDKVGAFLEATRAQYILTTPNTNNLNVFKPSDLTLVTQKRRHPDPWAPPVAFVKRDPRERQAKAERAA